MGRDTRRPKSGLDRNKYYKAEYVQNMQLTSEAIAKGVFYSTDYEPINHGVVLTGSVRHKQITLKIVTEDHIPDLETDDYVLNNGNLWIVESFTQEEVKDGAKPFRNNPLKTIITLRR